MQMREQSIEKQNKINKQLEELKNKKEQIALKLNLTIEEVEILAEKL
jgi:predicted transposase YdaD